MEKSNQAQDKKPVPKSAKPKKETEKVEVPAEDQTPFELELRKKLRNKNKKLDGIKELETKLKKDKSLVADEAQKAKVASKAQVLAEIADVEE